jgi:DNA-binding transcriptional LysR family regulator
MFDLKHLRVLREVANRGSFSAAAEALAYTQPAVSQQIALLERQAGVRLLDRTPRGVRLTDAGRALVEHAEAVLARLSAAEAELEAIAGLRGGRVRLASFSTAGAAIAPPAVALYQQRYPEVELSLIEAEPEDAVRMLRAGELEVALVLEHSDADEDPFAALYEGLHLRHLVDDPMYLALPRDHPAARRRRLRLEDFADAIWIQNDVTHPCGRLHLSACQLAGFEPRIAFHSDDYNVVQGLVAAGTGLSMLPALALTNLRDDIVVRSLGRGAPYRKISAAALEERYRSPATNAMLEVLDEVAAGFHLPTEAVAA